MKTWLNDNLLKLVAITMLLGALVSSFFGALFTFPFAYYQLMNWAVTGGALLIVWQAYKNRDLYFTWLFALVAVVFNPIASIYLNTLAWQIADIIVIILFTVSFFLIKEKQS